MWTPLYPSLPLPVVDSNWFTVDKPIDEDAELTQLENQHQQSQNEINQRDSDLILTGQVDNFEDEEEEDDDNDDDDDDEESESNDDDEEIEVDDLHFNPESPVINLT